MRVVIAGAGHAGGASAAFLRQMGHPGPITLIGAERAPPYQRPPLSKALLKGECDFDALKLKPDAFYADRKIDLVTGLRVTGLDRAARRVLTADGRGFDYDALILAFGSRNRRLAAIPPELSGVHELRSLKDADGLKPNLTPGRRVVVVGGGYVGLEAAASARALGAQVTVAEAAPRVLARTGSAPLAAFFEAYHRDRGVQVLTGVGVAGVQGGPDGAVRAVTLADGRVLDCDTLLVGIGADAEDALARDAGLACADMPAGGVVVDLEARTSDPAVFAIGDMTVRPLPLYENRMMRLESVPNALEQARQAAAAITGAPPPKGEVPWFWSDQFDLKLQIAGLALEADTMVTRGDVAAGRFAVFHMKQGRLRAVEAVNAGADFMAGRMAILNGAAPDPARLADPGAPIRQTLGC